MVSRVQEAERILLLLDYDGTVAAIQDHPSLAYPDPSVRSALSAIAADFWEDLFEEKPPRIVAGVLSGRALDDLRRRTCFSEFAYSGNYGLEIDAFGLKYVNPDAESRREQLAGICRRIAEATDSIPGAFVENKGLTATIHYRRTPDALARGLPVLLARILAPVTESFQVLRAHRAWDVIPRTGFHKGTAAAWMREAFGHDRLAIYIGDDRSDEDAFAELSDGLTIRVGEPADSIARYWLPDLKAVAAFISWVRNARGAFSNAPVQNFQIASNGFNASKKVR